MKKSFYLVALLLLAVVAGAAYRRYDAKIVEAPALKERSAKIGLESEWLNAKQAILGLVAKLKANPKDQKTRLQLALAYISEGRVTGDHAYYDAAALQMLDQILAAEPNNFEAICAKATVLLSQHHFAEAKILAEQAIAMNKYSAFAYGALTDACVELGEYDRAVIAADSMNELRPDIRSYSRIAYLREILGNIEGAKEVMKMAVESGYPSLEQTEWSRVQLGRLYEMTGDTVSARKIYATSLEVRPKYAYALAGMGRLAKLQGRYTEAIGYFRAADEAVIDFSFQEALADVYILAGQPEKAKVAAQKVVEMLQYDPTKTGDEANAHGHYSDRELAFAYLRTGDMQRAMQHADIEYKRRPLNIDANEVMAWTMHKAGKSAQALPFAKAALRTNSQNPLLLWRMSQVFSAAGNATESQKLADKALKINRLLISAIAPQTM